MQTAIISAAASGIGLAIARGLNTDGWRVYVCDSDETALIALAQTDPAFLAHACDVSDAGAVEAFYHAVETDLARAGLSGIDLLVNNAGVSGPTARLEDQPVEDWLRTIDINISGMFLMTRRGIPLLRAKGPGGSIITMSSNAGLMGMSMGGSVAVHAAGQPQALTGGLRAEHLKLAPATNRNLPAEVCHVEGLGNEQLLTCRLLEGDHLVQLRADPDQALVPGQTVHLEVEASGWRLFDAAGEKKLLALTIQQPSSHPRTSNRHHIRMATSSHPWLIH